MLIVYLLILLVLVTTCVVAEPWNPNPVADEKAIVVQGRARFTILDSRLVRIEYANEGSM